MGHDRRGDRARLRRVHGLAEERYDAIVERFYALLEQDPVASEALSWCSRSKMKILIILESVYGSFNEQG